MFLKFVWQSLLILILGAVIGFGINTTASESLALVRQPAPVMEEEWNIVSPEEVKEFAEAGTAIIIDARDPAEYEAGHIQTAINVPVEDFDTHLEIIDSLPREGFPIVVYCQGGECDQSHELLEKLEELGFMDLYLYQEGWNTWDDLGYPTGEGA